MTILLTETEKELAKERDRLAAQLAQVSGDLTRAQDEIQGFRGRLDSAGKYADELRADLLAARSALDEVTQERDARLLQMYEQTTKLRVERDAATKALDVAEARIARTSERLSKLSNAQLSQLTLGAYERVARVRDDHATAELAAENARLRQALATADRLGDEAMDCCLKAVNMLDGMRVERDEARALLAEAVSQGGDSGLWVVVEFDPDGQIKDIEFPLYESRTEAAEIAARISWSRLARLVWDRALLTEALKDGDE